MADRSPSGDIRFSLRIQTSRFFLIFDIAEHRMAGGGLFHGLNIGRDKLLAHAYVKSESIFPKSGVVYRVRLDREWLSGVPCGNRRLGMIMAKNAKNFDKLL